MWHAALSVSTLAAVTIRDSWDCSTSVTAGQVPFVTQVVLDVTAVLTRLVTVPQREEVVNCDEVYALLVL